MSDPGTEFTYDLPPELIAQDPPEVRGDSRLLLAEPELGFRSEHAFSELPDLLCRGDLLVLNDSRVFPARLETRRADTGGRIEILLVEPTGSQGRWLALARPVRRLRPGLHLVVLDGRGTDAQTGEELEVAEVRHGGEVVVGGAVDPAAVAERWGVMPLPPYIKRQEHDPVRAARDRRRYQTVYARSETDGGSVAAPTAGLHFAQDVLQALQDRGIGTARVCLHVGPGTFRAPDEDQIASQRLHPERFVLPEATGEAMAETRRRGGRVIAVGTTSLRVLETAARLDLPAQATGPIEFAAGTGTTPPVFVGKAECRGRAWEVAGVTRLFIRPPERITAADGLLTNFHLPGSSLLMLVASLLGAEAWRSVYGEAVARRLRFFSYGDCMLVLPREKGSR